MAHNSNIVQPDSDKQPQGETISELAHRHLMDPNHVTTDEELRNVKMEFHTEDASNELDEAATQLDDEEGADGPHFEREKNNNEDDDLPGEKDILVTPLNVTH